MLSDHRELIRKVDKLNVGQRPLNDADQPICDLRR